MKLFSEFNTVQSDTCLIISDRVCSALLIRVGVVCMEKNKGAAMPKKKVIARKKEAREA